MLEAVVNVSEGRDASVLDALAAAAGHDLLDLHADPDHNRAVLTLVGEDAPRRVAAVAVERIDLRVHEGVHPRFGAVDVVPFVPLGSSSMTDAVEARERFARWLADEHGVPCFRYGPERDLPTVRRLAFRELAPDVGPAGPHPTAGACAVGARGVLVAYNLFLADGGVAEARRVAAAVRGDGIRALGFEVGGRGQVSMNLIEPLRVGPAEAYDRVAALAPVAEAELVGLLPAQILSAVPADRWTQLGIGPEVTIEARLERGAPPRPVVGEGGAGRGDGVARGGPGSAG